MSLDLVIFFFTQRPEKTLALAPLREYFQLKKQRFYMKNIMILLTALFLFQNASAQDLDAYEKKMYITGKDTLRYRVLYPENYKKKKAYPLIVFLHGSGERGNDNEAQLTHGGKVFLTEENRNKFQAIVIFPQCPKDSVWVNTKRIKDSDKRVFLSDDSPSTSTRLVKELMDELVAKKTVNSQKIYLGGLSLGGYGTYDMLIRYPGYFSAAFPICGACTIPLYMERAGTMPLWIFHGAMDKSVSPESDRELYKNLIARGDKNITYTEYPTMGHNSWDSAFIEPKLLPWLFANKNKKAK